MLRRNALSRRAVSGVAASLLLALTISTPAESAGLLVADGGFGGVLEIEEHEVQVTVDSGIAVTEVTQVFRNTEKRQVEALYTFPVPKGASVASFSMWIGGKEMVGEVVEKERARQIYDSYKRRRIDPGLLEQTDFKTFEMRIFPIGPEASQKVKATYYQELEFDKDWATYVYPLATSTRSDVDARARGKFAINVDVRSAIPITEMESPSHPDEFVVARHSDIYRQASMETTGGDLSQDFVVAFKVKRPRTGFDLVASKKPDEDGYFLLTLTIGDDLSERESGMDYVFVLDVSGSMRFNAKMRTSAGSITAFVDSLDANDRFELLSFNVAPTPLFGQLAAATPEKISAATTFLNEQSARGGTDVGSALRLAYNYGEADRTLNVVLLSDGLTKGEASTSLQALVAARPANARVFCIGVGNDVNRPLLERVAERSGGLAAFISRGDNFTRQAAAFRRKLMRPAVSDARIKITSVDAYDVTPTELPNLYHGAPLRMYGRYRRGGKAKIEFTGDVNGRQIANDIDIEFPADAGDHPQVERMWALRRVDDLVRAGDGRPLGRDAIEAIINLGETHSIVTEYTSFLVLENDAEYRRWKIERTNLARITNDRDARDRLAKSLEAIRRSAVDGLGPAVAANATKPQDRAEPLARHVNEAREAPTSTASPPSRDDETAWNASRRDNGRRSRSSRSSGGGGGFGGGPVGPIFLGGALWLWNRERRRQQRTA